MVAMRSLTLAKRPRRLGLADDNPEEDFAHVQLRPVRGEVQGDPRVAGQSGADLGIFVGGIVVEYHVQGNSGGRLLVICLRNRRNSWWRLRSCRCR
jgi:hypothetical protein